MFPYKARSLLSNGLQFGHIEAVNRDGKSLA